MLSISRILSILFICLFFSSAPLCATEEEKYVQIFDKTELVDGGYYLIGSASVNCKKGFFLTSKAKQKPVNSLTGFVSAYYNQETINENIDSILVWQLRKVNNRFVLCRPNSELGLGTISTSIYDILINKSPIEWSVTASNVAGFFHFQAPNLRYLGCAAMNSTAPYFRLYTENGADSIGLKIFKSSKNVDPNIPKTNDTLSIAVMIKDSLYVMSGKGVISGRDLLLDNDNLAYSYSISSFKVVTDNDQFSLYDKSQGYLSVNNKHEIIYNDKATLWHFYRSFLVTILNSDTLCLMYDDVLKSFQVYNIKDCSSINLYKTKFWKCGTPSSYDYDAQRKVKTLYGSWSAKSLSLAVGKDILTLDLSHLNLPVYSKPFENQEPNMLTLVSKNQLNSIPDDWKNVIVQTDNGYQLYKSMSIVDKQPINISVSFSLGNNCGLTYSRKLIDDKGYETIILPFNVGNIPNNLYFAKPSRLSDDKIELSQVFSLEANVPYLFRCNDQLTDNVLKLVADNQLITTTPEYSSVNYLYGVYDPYVVKNTKTFFVSSNGDSFVRAAYGSHLCPFRAYLDYDGLSINSFLVKPSVTSVQNTFVNDNTGKVSYTLSGRIFSKNMYSPFIIKEKRVHFNSR